MPSSKITTLRPLMGDSDPSSASSKPSSQGPPSQQAELRELAKGSRGESRFSGYRGLVDHGKANVGTFSLAQGLSAQDENDLMPAQVEAAKLDKQREKADQLQGSVLREVGSGNKKSSGIGKHMRGASFSSRVGSSTPVPDAEDPELYP